MLLDPKSIQVITKRILLIYFVWLENTADNPLRWTVEPLQIAWCYCLIFIWFKPPRISSWMENGPEDCRCAMSDKGWIDSTCFLDWFENLFIPSITKERPVVLIFDGHKSHISVPLNMSAVKNNVILFKLPLNSTHKLQPLDVGVYGPLKTAWEKILISFAWQNLDTALTKDIFPSLFKKLWTSGCLSKVTETETARSKESDISSDYNDDDQDEDWVPQRRRNYTDSDIDSTQINRNAFFNL